MGRIIARSRGQTHCLMPEPVTPFNRPLFLPIAGRGNITLLKRSNLFLWIVFGLDGFAWHVLKL